jgi:hypothetical protein
MTTEMTTEMTTKIYHLEAPGFLTFCCVGKRECCKLCESMGPGTASKIDKSFQNLVSKGGTFEIVYYKKALIRIPSTIIPLQASLLRNDIPIELVNIVDNYYGSAGSVEALLYPMIADMIGIIQCCESGPRVTKLASHLRLPAYNIPPKEFTKELYWNFAFEVKCLTTVESTLKTRLICIDPKLFYTVYKKINNLGDTFKPQKRTKKGQELSKAEADYCIMS